MRHYKIAFLLGILAASILFYSIHSLGSAGKKQETIIVTDEVPIQAIENGNKKPSIIYDKITARDSEVAFIREGEKQANAVLSSDCFKTEVLNAKFTETKGLSNAQIYAKFVDASPYKVGIKMFTGSYTENVIWRTVGYEGNPIRMNRHFVYTPTYVASTSLHEAFGHGLGFAHYTPKMNPNSVPYTLNRIFEKCAKQIGFKIKY